VWQRYGYWRMDAATIRFRRTLRPRAASLKLLIARLGRLVGVVGQPGPFGMIGLEFALGAAEGSGVELGQLLELGNQVGHAGF
jgi:hypothetical protein